MRCAWCRGFPAVLVIGGCLDSHIFEITLCAQCEGAIREAYCPECLEKIEEVVTIPLSEINAVRLDS